MPGTISSQSAPGPHKQLASEAEAWVQSTLASLTLEEKIGQLVLAACYGGFLPEDSPAFRNLATLVERRHIGGLMIATRPGALGIERSHVFPTAALVNSLQQRARIPLLVAGDFERGTAMRLEEGTSFPHAMAVAATGRPEDAYTMGRITALEGRACGVPWIYAPVVDVNSNPANPIINIRSFGETPEQIAPFAAAFIRGVQENGGLATAKHFPGHGDTDLDSHLGLPLVRAGRARLEKTELPPFRQAIQAGVGAVMTGHLAVPALEPEAGLPATVSRNIITCALRQQLGFDGLVVSDSLDMAGVAGRFPAGEAAVRAILAGSDLVLALPDAEPALFGLRQAAESGRLPLSVIDRAAGRVLRAKAWLGLHQNRLAALERLPQIFGVVGHEQAAQDIAGRGVTLLRDAAHILPLDPCRPRRALLVAIAGDPDGMPAESFETDLRPRLDSLDVWRFDTRYHPVPKSLPLPSRGCFDLLIIALLVRVTDRKGTLGLPPEQIALVRRLLACKTPALLVCFGNPYLLAQFPKAKTWLAVFSNAEVAQRAASRAIFGQTPIGGRIPVTIPGVLKRGSGIDIPANPMRLAESTELKAQLAPAYAVLERAVALGAFPGGVLAVGRRGAVAIQPAGRQTYQASSPLVTPQTIYDAASLTKPVVTATVAAMLVESGQLELDAPVSRFLPEWACGPRPAWRAQVSVRHLLAHASGLPAYREYFRTAGHQKSVLAQALAEHLEARPGSRTLYSDVGYILLGEILARLAGKPLNEVAREKLFAPLEMNRTFFNPPPEIRAEIAPTEQDDAFRNRLVHGEVHDENAWCMGGVAGHAGMFSSAADLASFCQMLLNGGQYAHRRLLRRLTIQQFTAPDPAAGGRRALGWDVPAAPSSSGRYFSRRSFGHLGYTGTSLWIDPEKELFVVLLTNRVHPTRKNEKIRDVRPALHDAVIEALELVPARRGSRLRGNGQS